MPMPHTIALHDDETAMSFASRLAFSNKLPSLVEFTADFGLTLSNLLNCDASAMATLAELGALDVRRLIERSFRSSGKSSFHILNHEIGRPHLDIGSNRMCPACFRADIGDPMTEASIANAYGRILWNFASARTCPVHQLLLIVPPEEDIKHDFLPSWTPWLTEVVDGDLDQPVNGGGLLEHHIAARLRGEAPEGWATRFPIDILGSACEVLGALELFGKEVVLADLTEIDLAAATGTGFARLNAGPPALLLLFETIRTMPAAPQDKLQARYGPLYRWFTSGVGKDAAFAPLRDVFRKHVFATWPLAEGDSVLNFRLPERRLHSIRTASIAHGLHAKRLRRLLVDAGIIPETDRPDFDVIFDALKAQPILEGASGAVNFAAAQRRLGMTRTQMETLIGAGLLTPGEGGDKARPRFTEATIQEWTDLFNKYPEASASNALSSVADTASSLGVSTDDILRLMLDGQLREIKRMKGKVGLASLLIHKETARNYLRGMPDKQTSKPISTVSSDLRIGRHFLLQLAQAGHFQPIGVTDSRTNQPGTRILDEEVALFDARYVSRRYLSRNGKNALVVKRELDAKGVVPVFSSADGREFIYLRVDLPVA